MEKTELRLDALSQEWTIFSESRALPPAFAPITHERLAASPFGAGLERYAAHTLHQENGAHVWQVRVVPNRVPILRVEGDSARHGEELYQHLTGVGAHEIVIEDPADCRFEDLLPADRAKVIDAWRARIEDLMRDSRLRTFTVVKNVGCAAGQTVAHSLSEVVAMAVVPSALRRKLESARAYYALRARSLFADTIEEERRLAARMVFENDGFIVFCPYASRAPFELAVWPKRPSPDFHHITEDEAVQLAEALRVALQKLNRTLDHPAWHLSLTTAPSRAPVTTKWTTIAEDFRWHLSLLPRLHPTGALELATGCHVNGVWPETAAAHLRSLEVAP